MVHHLGQHKGEVGKCPEEDDLREGRLSVPAHLEASEGNRKRTGDNAQIIDSLEVFE